MSWRTWSISSLDWSTKVRVTPSASGWARKLNGGAGGSSTFLVADEKVAETANEETLAPWSRMIVNEFQGLIVYAGFITSMDYDFDTKTYNVTHEDIWAVLARRIMVSILDYGVEKTKLIYTGVSLVNLVKQAIYQGQNDAARFNLPIVLPSDETGAESRTYPGYHLPTVVSILEDIMDNEGGPDLDFFPRWFGDGQVEWFLRMGDLRDGVWEWDCSSNLSPVTGLKERVDGTKMANRVTSIGEGSEKKMLVFVTDGSATSSFLPLDATTSYKDEDNYFKLAGRARADLAVREKPTRQVSMDVQMDENFAVHQLRLGGTVKWRTQGDPHFGTGWHSSRLIEFSGDLTNRIHLEFQTEGE